MDMLLSGHDHNQQLLLRAGEPAWVISGAGGQSLYALKTPEPDSTFATSSAGFAKIDLDANQLRLAYYNDLDGLEVGYLWAIECPWMAKGCLLPDESQGTSMQLGQ
ncbi:hypothetical protein [Pseudomonas sp. ML2-2023-3]|uniref:hypothetical protein n=1 Tax=Pseudomonas sp. ML2-2023-3 TaxID=3122375 RepID=UPI0030D40EC8